MVKDNKKSAAKVFSIIGTVLSIIVSFIVAVIIVSMVVCRVKNKPISIFGVSFAIVQTQSMEPYIMTGDLISYKLCEYSDVKVGDYIVFIAGDGFGSHKGQYIVHEAIEIKAEGILTQGKNTNTNKQPDGDLVTAENLVGKCTYNSAALGKIFVFLSKYGIFIVLIIIALLLFVKRKIIQN